MAVSIDTSELTALARDLDEAAASIVERVRPVMSRAGLNVKRQLVADMAASPSFRGVARAISYDVRQDRAGFLVEVGPDKARDGGALANIAYFGAPSTGGGATVPDPMVAGLAEVPALERYLGEVLEALA